MRDLEYKVTVQEIENKLVFNLYTYTEDGRFGEINEFEVEVNEQETGFAFLGELLHTRAAQQDGTGVLKTPVEPCDGCDCSN